MTFIRTAQVFAAAAVVAAACVAAPASASAGSLPSTFKSDAAQSGDRSGAQPYPPGGFWGLDPANVGGMPKSTFPSADFRGGDTPVDHPGARRAVTAAPTTIEVVRPERTIVRDVDEALPVILSSTALLLALAGLGVMLVRFRLVPRPGRSH
jgi:hypothetical protein